MRPIPGGSAECLLKTRLPRMSRRGRPRLADRRERCQPDGMSFFDSIPQPPAAPEPAPQPRPAWEQPDAVIPGSVPGELMLIRTGQVAVAIGSVRAYPNGFEFTAHVRLRDEDEDEPAWHDPFDRHRRRGRQPPADVLRLGLLYADGRRAATTSYWWPGEDADPGRLVLEQNGSGGVPADGMANSGCTLCRRRAR